MRFLSTSLLLIATVVSGVHGAELVTLANKKVTGDLVAMDDKTVTLNTSSGPVATPLQEVLLLNIQDLPRNPPARFHLVELTDGSLLHVSDFSIKGKTIELTLIGGQSVKMPLTTVSTVLRDAHDAKLRNDWTKNVIPRRGNRDQMVVNVEGSLKGLDGTFGDADEKGEKIDFELASNNQKVKPEVAKLAGMILAFQPDGNAPATLCKIFDTNSNQIFAAKMTLSDKGLFVTTVSGIEIKLANAQVLAKLDYSKGKLTYLSDIDPESVDESSTEEAIFHYRRDKNLDDGPIRLKGTPYQKGLAIHARTVLVYKLGGDYKDFSATVGVDELVGGESHVKLTIEGDGRELFAGEIKRGDDPKPLLLNVKGVKMLRITVASVDILDLGNHIDLAMAKVSK